MTNLNLDTHLSPQSPKTMAEISKKHQYIKIQTFALQLDPKIEHRSSASRQALETYLKVVADNPKCRGLYWMKTDETPEGGIVVISSSLLFYVCLEIELTILHTEWDDQVEEAQPESYVTALKSHILRKTLPDICIEDDKLNLQPFNNCALTTFYFPVETTTEDFKARVQARGKQFTDTIQSIHPSSEKQFNLISHSHISGWSTTPTQKDSQTTSAFIILNCTRPSQQKNDLSTQPWTSFLTDTQTFNPTTQNTTHGTLQQIRNTTTSKYVFEPDTDEDDEDDEEIDAQLNDLNEGVARIRKLAQSTAREFEENEALKKILGSCTYPGGAQPGNDEWIVLNRKRLDRIR